MSESYLFSQCLNSALLYKAPGCNRIEYYRLKHFKKHESSCAIKSVLQERGPGSAWLGAPHRDQGTGPGEARDAPGLSSRCSRPRACWQGEAAGLSAPLAWADACQAGLESARVYPGRHPGPGRGGRKAASGITTR